MTELKPCPFCGSKAMMLSWKETGEYWVQCEECEMKTDTHYDPKIAALVWNRRMEVSNG